MNQRNLERGRIKLKDEKTAMKNSQADSGEQIERQLQSSTES